MKLSGRPAAGDQRRRRTLSFSAGGAQPPTHHGPLQRLLDGILRVPLQILGHDFPYTVSEDQPHDKGVKS